MTYLSASLIWTALITMGRPGWASNSLGFDVTGGVGQSGLDTTGTLDVGPQSDWETSLSYAHLHSTTGTESKTDQWTGGVAYQFDPAWDSHMNVTYWKDTLNDIHYAGPTFGFTYTLKQGGHTATETSGEKKSEASDENDQLLGADEMNPQKINPIDERKKDQTAEAKDLMSVSLDADLFVYGTEVTASSTTRTVFNRKLRRFVKQLVPPSSGNEKTTQFHPNLTVEVPLFDEAFVPFVTVGHYFYSKDPSTIENLAGRPRLAASSGRLNSLVGGFLNNNGNVGFSSPLPGDVLLSGALGAEQLATDLTWATTQTASLSRTFFDRLRLKIEWDRAIQENITTDTFIGGLTYKFGVSSS